MQPSLDRTIRVRHLPSGTISQAMMTTATTMAPSLHDLQQLIRTVELRIELTRDPEQVEALEARKAEIQQQILDRGGVAPRLPYGDPE